MQDGRCKPYEDQAEIYVNDILKEDAAATREGEQEDNIPPAENVNIHGPILSQICAPDNPSSTPINSPEDQNKGVREDSYKLQDEGTVFIDAGAEGVDRADPLAMPSGVEKSSEVVVNDVPPKVLVEDVPARTDADTVADAHSGFVFVPASTLFEPYEKHFGATGVEDIEKIFAAGEADVEGELVPISVVPEAIAADAADDDSKDAPSSAVADICKNQ